MSTARKRKQPTRSRGPSHWAQAAAEEHSVSLPDPALFIKAHEADILRGPRAHAAAHSLEVVHHEQSGKFRAGDGLIRWQGVAIYQVGGEDSEEVMSLGRAHTTQTHAEEDEKGLWVDRYDARLLLEALPIVSHDGSADGLSSPGGWSDLPSDTEDTFFFSPDEAEDYRRDKRRRVIDQSREERLRVLRSEEGVDQQPAEEQWGGSDEEPDDAERDLMRRTASHILSSPNPAQLEMRILANHGADRRFAFLKGRWARAWRLAKTHARIESEQGKEQRAPAKVGLGGLASYGGSDSESGDGSVQSRDDAEKGDVGSEGGEPPNENGRDADTDEVKAARRARAKEWAEKRRLVQAASEGGASV